MFENIKHVDKYGEKFWYARELKNVLEYKECELVMFKAKSGM